MKYEEDEAEDAALDALISDSKGARAGAPGSGKLTITICMGDENEGPIDVEDDDDEVEEDEEDFLGEM